MDLTNCAALYAFFAFNSGNLREIKLSGCANPGTAGYTTDFYLNNCVSLTSLDLTDCVALAEISCCGCTQLSELKLTGLEKLKKVNVEETSLTELDLSASAGTLEYLNLNYNTITELNISGFTAITCLSCESGALEKLDISGCTVLQKVYACCNKLSSVRFSNCPALERLDLSDNELEKITVPSCPVLTYFNVTRNRLAFIDVSACPGLILQSGNDRQYPSKKLKAYRFGSGDLGEEYYVVDLAGYTGTFLANNITRVENGHRKVYSSEYSQYLIVIDKNYYQAHAGSDSYRLSYYYTYYVNGENRYSMGPVYTDIEFTEEPFVTGISYRGNVSDYLIIDEDTSASKMQLMTPFGPLPVLSSDTLDIPDGFRVSWRCSGGDEVAEVDEEGYLYPNGPGTAYITAEVNFGGSEYFASETLRLDICSGITHTEKGVIRASLPEDKVTVELFKTDYTTFDLMLELQQNLDYASVSSAISEEDYDKLTPEAVFEAIDLNSLKFTDTEADKYFQLVPVSDRKVKIVPRYEALKAVADGTVMAPSVLKSKISFSILYNRYFTTEQELTITLKQSRPTVKTKGITLNSNPYFIGTKLPLSFTGGTVSSFRLDNTPPVWLQYSTSANTVAYVGAADYKGKAELKLMCTVDGWSVEAPVSVKLTVKPVYPQIKLSQKSVTLAGGASDCASVYITVDEAFQGCNLRYLGYTEGKGKNLYVATGDDNLYVIVNTYSSAKLNKGEPMGYVTIGSIPNDVDAHNYNVLLEYAGKRFSIPVKLTATAKIPTAVSMKAKGGIDLGVQNSTITAVASIKGLARTNISFGIFSLDKIYRTDDVSKTDVQSCFSVDWGYNVLTLKAKEDHTGISAGKYAVDVKANLNGHTARGTLIITLKDTPKSKFAPKAKLKLSGWIDPLRENQYAVFEVSFNYPELAQNGAQYGYIRFYYKEDIGSNPAKYVNGLYASQNSYDGKYYMSANFYNNTAGLDGKVYARFEGTVENNGETGIAVYSDYIPVKFKQSPVKLDLKAPALTLSTKDCRDREAFYMAVKGGEGDRLLGITAHKTGWTGVSFADPKYAEIFDIVNGPSTEPGTFYVKWKDDKLPAAGTLIPGKTLSLKLNVLVDGNWTGKTNATATLKVKIC